MSLPIVYLATSASCLGKVAEDKILIDAFQRIGVPAKLAVWDDPTVGWEAASACVIRSTWDYTNRIDNYTDWINFVSSKTVLINHPDLVSWNLNKRYLLEIQELGIPTIPSISIETMRVDDAEYWRSAALEAFGEGQWILKPMVGAGGRGIKKIDSSAASMLGIGVG